jgi:hypothetical protein
MHPKGLPTDLPQFAGIGDELRSRIEVAPTARRELYSRLIARLEVSKRADPQRGEQYKAPSSRRVNYEESQPSRDCNGQGDHAETESCALAPRADVWDLGNRRYRSEGCCLTDGA